MNAGPRVTKTDKVKVFFPDKKNLKNCISQNMGDINILCRKVNERGLPIVLEIQSSSDISLVPYNIYLQRERYKRYEER